MFGSTGTSAPSSGGLFGTTGSNSNSKPATGGGLFSNTQSGSSGFSFGQPSTATFGGSSEKKDGSTPAPSLFGSGSNTFGQTASGNATAGSGIQKPTGTLFGSVGNTGSTTQSSLFGQSSTTNNDPKPLFGQQAAAATGGGGNIFGKPENSTKPTGGLFGNPGAASQIPGTPSQSSIPKISFGSTTPAPAPAGGSNFFGGPSTTPAGQPPTSLFGASTGGSSSQLQSQSGTQTTSSFGQTQTQTSTSSTKPGMFGTAGTPSLFGPKPVDNNTQSTPSFGGGFKLGQQSEKPAEAVTKPDPPKFSFPAATPTTSAPAQSQAPPSLFGAPKPADSVSSSTPIQPATAKSGGFSFGPTPSSSNQAQTVTSQAPAFAGFNLATTSAEKPTLFAKPAIPSTQSAGQSKPPGPMFPGLGTTQTTTASSASSTTATAQPPLFAGFGTTTSAPGTSATSTASPAAPAVPLFGLGATPATNAQIPSTTVASTTAPAQSKTVFGTSTPAGAKPSTMGTSTAGPVAPAQSRLRNRTMDEILTRWASDLTRYTKEFKGHAEQVAYWDQIIVDNSSKIDKLYVKTRTCEKQTMSVEMQLSAVENQQNELESWLSKYEGDVEEMLAKDGSSQNEPGGPDQERERTYQLAEKLGERLDDMGRDLQSMIEEVNAANAGLGKSSKVDEPITQIVKILNAHLSQLQAIDQGTASLQAKVSSAQKSASGMNYLNSSMNGDGRGAVDDFYRSYMGRR